ncbi:MAG: Virulence-associated protein E [Firmicutes bacterium ADurb.Bin146]|nr:MAG: Virulence-associated protein E [Firmicutes bacterium ADurb.Bin146]
MRALHVAYGNSCQAKFWSNKTTTWEELCARLATTIRTTETAEEYPKMKKADKEAAKDKGGFVGGQLKNNRRKIESVACRSILTMDVDHAEVGFIENFRENCRYAAAFYTTHGHTPEAPRVRILLPFTKDISADAYVALARFFADEWGIDQFDECSYKPNQLMYWPTTPSNGEFISEVIEGEWLDPDEYLDAHPNWKDCSLLPTSSRESTVRENTKKPQEDPLTKPGIVGAFCRTYGITAAIETFLDGIYAPSAVEGRYDYIPGEGCAGVVIYDDKFSYSHHATDPACGMLLNAFDLVRVHKFGDEDGSKSFKEMADFASRDENVKLLILDERQKEAGAEFTDISADSNEWKKKLRYTPRTQALENSLYNINLILRNDENLKGIVFNQLADGMEIKDKVPWKHPARFWRDADDAQLICYIDENYGTFSARNYDIGVTKVVDDRSYHPIKEYFAGLPEWDGVERVESLLIDYFGADDNKYVRTVTRKVLCAAIKRVFVPGIKFDYILVMNGPQGIGKSTFISKLGGEWYSDSLNLSDMNDKTAAEKLQGYWIMEIGELAGMKKADIDKVKAFISRQDDKYRASFGRRVTPHPRQCIFFGTTNSENGYLRDVTGNRRFWTVKTPGTGKKKPWEITQEEVDQIWAEALTYVSKGEKLYLPAELESYAKEEQSNAMEMDDREGLVIRYLDMLLPENWDSMDVFQRRDYVQDPNGPLNVKGTVKREAVSNIEIWCECFGKAKEDIKPSDSYAIAAIMTRLGSWEKCGTARKLSIYGKQRVYVRK